MKKDSDGRKLIDRIIRLGQVAEILGVNKSTISRWVKSGKLPRPIKFSRGVTGYRESTLKSWINKIDKESGSE